MTRTNIRPSFAYSSSNILNTRSSKALHDPLFILVPLSFLESQRFHRGDAIGLWDTCLDLHVFRLALLPRQACLATACVQPFCTQVYVLLNHLKHFQMQQTWPRLQQPMNTHKTPNYNTSPILNNTSLDNTLIGLGRHVSHPYSALVLSLNALRTLANNCTLILVLWLNSLTLKDTYVGPPVFDEFGINLSQHGPKSAPRAPNRLIISASSGKQIAAST